MKLDARLEAGLNLWADEQPDPFVGIKRSNQVARLRRLTERVASKPDGRVLVSGNKRQGVLALWQTAEWDSRVLRLTVSRCATLVSWGSAGGRRRTNAMREMSTLLAAAARETATDLVIARIDCREVAASATLQASGYQIFDTTITLARTLGIAVEDPRVEAAEAQAHDLRALSHIATALKTGHYHADPRLELGAARRVYREWTINSLRGHADSVLVLRDERSTAPLGFITCVIDRAALAEGTKIGVIELVAVDEAEHGRGRGRDLVLSALKWFELAGCTLVQVGTHVSNLSAVRLYVRTGFVPAGFSSTFHHWPS